MKNFLAPVGFYAVSVVFALACVDAVRGAVTFVRRFSLFVCIVVLTPFIPACESGIEKSITPVPIAEIQEPTPEGVVTVGNIEQVTPPSCSLDDPPHDDELQKIRRNLEVFCPGIQQ